MRLTAACRAVPLCLAAGALPAAAADVARYSGFFLGQGEGEIELRVPAIDARTGLATARAGVGLPGCAGAFAGRGRLTGRTLALAPLEPAKGAERCRVTVVFDPDGRGATIEESECLAFHGAACGFSGRLARLASGAEAALVGRWTCEGACPDEELAFGIGREGRRFSSWRQARPSILGGRWRLAGRNLSVTRGGQTLHEWRVAKVADDRVVLLDRRARAELVLTRAPD